MSEIPIIHPSIATPNPGQQGLEPLLVADIIDPTYREGCNLVFQRPGELGIVVTVSIPQGAMIMMIVPEQALHVRAAVRQAVARAQAEHERQMNGLGRRG